jgi:Arc/MetJ-type ribon-helix-helix transcriptional regulator
MGRKIKTSAERLGDTNFTVSLKKTQTYLLPILDNVVKDGVGKTRSAVVITALELFLEKGELREAELRILNEYADQKLKGPRFYKEFVDILEWALDNMTFKDMARDWGVSIRDIAKILFKYSGQLK